MNSKNILSVFHRQMLRLIAQHICARQWSWVGCYIGGNWAEPWLQCV